MKSKLVILLVSACLTACAQHAPTKGDEMLTMSNNAKQLSGQWEKGNKLAASGNAQNSKGLAMIADGEGQVSKGNELIAQGNRMTQDGKHQAHQGRQIQQESEDNFDDTFASSPQA